MDINEAIQVFSDSDSESAEQLRKAEIANQISKSLKKLSGRVDEVVTNLICEAAVIEAKVILSTDGML